MYRYTHFHRNPIRDAGMTRGCTHVLTMADMAPGPSIFRHTQHVWS